MHRYSSIRWSLLCVPYWALILISVGQAQDPVPVPNQSPGLVVEGEITPAPVAGEIVLIDEAACCDNCGDTCPTRGCRICRRKPGGHLGGLRHRCPRCRADGVCVLSSKDAKEEKTCYRVESKTICIPAIRLPWQKCDTKCGRAITVQVLKKEKYECPTCEYEWTVVQPPCDPSQPMLATNRGDTPVMPQGQVYQWQTPTEDQRPQAEQPIQRSSIPPIVTPSEAGSQPSQRALPASHPIQNRTPIGPTRTLNGNQRPNG